jgi:hypothetical protein
MIEGRLKGWMGTAIPGRRAPARRRFLWVGARRSGVRCCVEGAQPMANKAARSRELYVSLTLRVREEFLERLDQWRALHLPEKSRTATVVAIIEERIAFQVAIPQKARQRAALLIRTGRLYRRTMPPMKPRPPKSRPPPPSSGGGASPSPGFSQIFPEITGRCINATSRERAIV